MKKVIIAEKPSLAMTIVQAIGGNFKKNDGYFENDKYVVTFGFGHLFQLYSIDDYFDREKTKWKNKSLAVSEMPLRLKAVGFLYKRLPARLFTVLRIAKRHMRRQRI